MAKIGHVEGFVMVDETWAIRYLEVATKNWWPGKEGTRFPVVDPTCKLGRFRSLPWPLPGRRQDAPRRTRNPARSLVNMRISSTVTTASRHIGCTKPKTSLRFP